MAEQVIQASSLDDDCKELQQFLSQAKSPNVKQLLEAAIQQIQKEASKCGPEDEDEEIRFQKLKSNLDFLIHGLQFFLGNFATTPNTGFKATPELCQSSQLLHVPYKNTAHKFEIFADPIFSEIRTRDQISTNQFASSWDLTQTTGSVGEGKSGALFLTSKDSLYFLKTISKTEKTCFRSWIDKYMKRLSVASPRSLLLRIYFFAHYKGESVKNKEFVSDHHTSQFIIFNNLFTSEREREIFDLKGSLIDRKRKKGQKVFKDQDFLDQHRKIRLGPKRKTEFLERIKEDVKLLASNEIMDYSLLIAFSQLGASETVSPEEASSGFVEISEKGDEMYTFGIIDHFTKFNLQKTLAHNFKGMFEKRSELSTVKPDFYAERFIQFLDAAIE